MYGTACGTAVSAKPASLEDSHRAESCTRLSVASLAGSAALAGAPRRTGSCGDGITDAVTRARRRSLDGSQLAGDGWVQTGLLWRRSFRCEWPYELR